MDDFEYFFAFVAILLGLTVAELATRFSDALRVRKQVRLGWLTPLLAIFLLLDVSSLMLWLWASRAIFTISWMTVWGGLFVGIVYFVSAAMVFPRVFEGTQSLDDHYCENKKWVIAGILLVNLLIYGVQFARALPEWTDSWFWFGQAIYWVPLVWLLFARSRRLNLALLAILIVQYVATSALSGPGWGNPAAIDAAAPLSASTNAAPPPR